MNSCCVTHLSSSCRFVCASNVVINLIPDLKSCGLLFSCEREIGDWFVPLVIYLSLSPSHQLKLKKIICWFLVWIFRRGLNVMLVVFLWVSVNSRMFHLHSPGGLVTPVWTLCRWRLRGRALWTATLQPRVLCRWQWLTSGEWSGSSDRHWLLC